MTVPPAAPPAMAPPADPPAALAPPADPPAMTVPPAAPPAMAPPAEPPAMTVPPAAPPAATAPPAAPPADEPPAAPPAETAPPATPPPVPPIESVHRPTTHAWARAPQSTQLAPFEPHALVSTPAEHCPSAAQHPEQVAALQTCGREGLQAAHISISHINQRIETPGRNDVEGASAPAQGGHRMRGSRTSDFTGARAHTNQCVRRTMPKYPRIWVGPSGSRPCSPQGSSIPFSRWLPRTHRSSTVPFRAVVHRSGRSDPPGARCSRWFLLDPNPEHPCRPTSLSAVSRFCCS